MIKQFGKRKRINIFLLVFIMLLFISGCDKKQIIIENQTEDKGVNKVFQVHFTAQKDTEVYHNKEYYNDAQRSVTLSGVKQIPKEVINHIEKTL